MRTPGATTRRPGWEAEAVAYRRRAWTNTSTGDLDEQCRAAVGGARDGDGDLVGAIGHVASLLWPEGVKRRSAFRARLSTTPAGAVVSGRRYLSSPLAS